MTGPFKLNLPCGATKVVKLPSGKTQTVHCTRFQYHREKAKRNPLRHFDQWRKVGWYDDSPPSPEETNG